MGIIAGNFMLDGIVQKKRVKSSGPGNLGQNERPDR